MEDYVERRNGPDIDTQDWTFEAATGEHLEMHIRYERGSGNKSNPADAKFYSAKTPGYVQISHQEQVLDVKESSIKKRRRQLRKALRRQRKAVELGQHPVDQPLGICAIGNYHFSVI